MEKIFSSQLQTQVDLLKRIKKNIGPINTTSHLPMVEDLIDIGMSENHEIIYKAKTYRDESLGHLSWLKILHCLKTILVQARRGISFSKKEDVSGFNHLHILMGAQAAHICRIKINVKGYENLDPNRSYIFAPTHGSILDSFLLYLVLNSWNLGFLVKDEFRTNFFLHLLAGKAMKYSNNFFFVQRGDISSGMEAMNQITTHVINNKNKISMVLFPQGTLSKARIDNAGKRIDGDLYAKGPLQGGVAYLSMATLRLGNPIEIVPIVVNGVNRIWPKISSPILVNQNVEYIISKPIHPSEFQNTTKPIKAILKKIDQVYRANYKAPISPS